MKALIAAALIVATPGLACAESWVLWKGDPWSPRMGPVKPFASEADCKVQAKRMVNAWAATEAPKYRPGKRVVIINDGMMLTSVERSDYEIDGKKIGEYLSPFLTMECWPAGVNPR